MSVDLLEAISTNGGFTYDPTTDHLYDGSTPQHGFAIAVPGTEYVLGDASLTREGFAEAFATVVLNNEYYIASGCVVGGWYSTERGVYMVEITDIFDIDREDAVRIGRLRNQEAIYDLATGEEIPTGGTGDAQ